MAPSGLPPFITENYEVHEWRHASAILVTDYPDELAEIVTVLEKFRVHRSEINVGGGSKSKVAGRIDAGLTDLGWKEKEVRDEDRCRFCCAGLSDSQSRLL